MLENRLQPVLAPPAWAHGRSNRRQIDGTVLPASAGLEHFARKKTIILNLG